ncbi:primase-helicase family protein [Flavobacterium sp. SUN046]|uniref:primase-helicase family protein n=1 Tax=Flavobacterium sp. SUN046 TaxID=3002440 RepID=UPI002DB8CA22|nr:primase-helicase family protein [Flavobacterium sp. SUN046]MEC4048563.1 primase-helicase family protein [Flavobacterium sp. SUN046]
MKEYIRVGTEYFKEVLCPLMSGDNMKSLIKWNKATIIDDFGKDSLKGIKKYETFCTFPSHINYQREINNFYNKYEPLSYCVSDKGDWENIKLFLQHLFGKQYELALDYLTILWKYPSQILPILCLVSVERNTGKSTFLKLLKLIFEGNMTINKNEDFRSRFNSDWAGKLIVAVDEVLLDKKEDSERIKNLSTSNHYKLEGKGVDKAEIEFFGKFILCSNNEENFIKIDDLEIRYWVIKVNSFAKENPDLLEQMRKEIASFAYHLTHRKIETQRTTRMWFTKEQIYTKALDVLVRGNRTSIEKEIEEFLIDQFCTLELDELYYTTKDLHEQLNLANIRVGKNYVSKIITENFKLEPKNSSYNFYSLDLSTMNNGKWSVYTENRKGRFYTFKKEEFIK